MTTPYHTCLLINDSYTSNFVHKKLLIQCDFAEHILVYQHSWKALDDLLNGTIKPDVIFLDLKMPIIDGFAFLEAYDRLYSNKEDIKIFVLSATVNPLELKKIADNKQVTRFINEALTPPVIESLKC